MPPNTAPEFSISLASFPLFHMLSIVPGVSCCILSSIARRYSHQPNMTKDLIIEDVTAHITVFFNYATLSRGLNPLFILEENEKNN